MSTMSGKAYVLSRGIILELTRGPLLVRSLGTIPSRLIEARTISSNKQGWDYDEIGEGEGP
jgi:hypothetical protein